MADVLGWLDSTGRSLLPWVAWMTLWTAILAVAAHVLDRLLAPRVGAAWRLVLPLAVLARLALPVSWASPVGIAQSETPWSVGSAPATVARPTDVTATQVELAPAAPAIAPTWPAAAAAVYLLGVAILLGCWFIARLDVARALARSGATRAERIVEHDVLGPAVIGVLRPRIVLPRGLAATLDATQLDAIVRHESAHVSRADHLLAALVQLVTIAAWPILPAWLAALHVRALMEEACDEAAVRGRAAAERADYGRTLLAMAERRAAPRLRVPLGLLPFGTRLERRVRALRHARRWPLLLQAAPVLALVATMLGLATRRASAEAAPAIEVDAWLVQVTPETLERIDAEWQELGHGARSASLDGARLVKAIDTLSSPGRPEPATARLGIEAGGTGSMERTFKLPVTLVLRDEVDVTFVDVPLRLTVDPVMRERGLSFELRIEAPRAASGVGRTTGRPTTTTVESRVDAGGGLVAVDVDGQPGGESWLVAVRPADDPHAGPPVNPTSDALDTIVAALPEGARIDGIRLKTDQVVLRGETPWAAPVYASFLRGLEPSLNITHAALTDQRGERARFWMEGALRPAAQETSEARRRWSGTPTVIDLEDKSLDEMLGLFGDILGFPVHVDRAVAEREVTIVMDAVPSQQVLPALLRMQELEGRWLGTTLHVRPRTPGATDDVLESPPLVDVHARVMVLPLVALRRIRLEEWLLRSPDGMVSLVGASGMVPRDGIARLERVLGRERGARVLSEPRVLVALGERAEVVTRVGDAGQDPWPVTLGVWPTSRDGELTMHVDLAVNAARNAHGELTVGSDGMLAVTFPLDAPSTDVVLFTLTARLVKGATP